MEKEMKVVVKKMPKPTAEDSQHGTPWNDSWKVDLAKLAAVKCRHIVQIFDAFEDDNDAYIFLEYCEKKDLRNLMRDQNHVGLPFSEEVSLISDILFATFLLYSHRSDDRTHSLLARWNT
jgi:serine/threonine protein kinase